jgi:hypothetical protein
MECTLRDFGCARQPPPVSCRSMSCGFQRVTFLRHGKTQERLRNQDYPTASGVLIQVYIMKRY